MQISSKYSIPICCGLIVIVGLAFFFQPKKDSVKPAPVKKKTEIVAKVDSVASFDTTACSDVEVKLFLKEFIKQFHTNKAANINKFVDKNDGLAIFVKDGYYPVLSFSNGIDDRIEWFNFKIYENVMHEPFPEYLGDTEFKKKGFFYIDYKNKFSLDDFDDIYSARTDEDKKPFRILEKTCNYRADAMSVDGNLILTLYFRIYRDKKQLVAITQDTVEDHLFTDPQRAFIKIDTELEVEEFLLNHRKFCDSETKGYIDFDKKELTYCDFGDKPFSFTGYKIDSISNLSQKIKVREIEFFNSKEKFTLRLSNKGTFTSYQMGARPLYIYSVCDK
ncbi:hypothetical protein [Flavobacterium reichenbachii]|uniref:Uncharacterized protein n=1 Tax=Flavobacterium reichenbachii TaxID=362418 RepID=A0A085ZQ47_9FLAO|nr:hypothetical protein [Flavobacterium reichenbachii]KFF06561.1 hypothetical protein IW19_14045 [Flavobacterium reichenbachii]OXB18834.1 hypothetical protein B0A68_02145 [Flavobacterium reichenbachii]